MKRTLTYTQAVNEALTLAMEQDPHLICYGLGVDDPKRIFGTTAGLVEKFGKNRVFDMPTSENAMTGVAIGAGLNGIRTVMVHQRLDFFLLAMDQLVNGAAKWHYMFGGQANVPITIRLIMGRGWGQGPTHSQNLHAWFTHVPGLKVVMPATAADAKGLLLSSIFDDNPVIFMEHRWLHHQEGIVPEGNLPVPLGKCHCMREGKDVTIVAMSYMSIEALKAAEYLANFGVDCEVIDLRTLAPLDWDTIFESVRKTGRLLALDTGNTTGSFAGEIVARVSINLFKCLKGAPQRIALPDFPTPTSPALTKDFYPGHSEIVQVVSNMMGLDISRDDLIAQHSLPHDVPGEWFRGPF